ncbi:MAG: MFS transporter [Candidatus Hodarchaeota archaeon]
MKNKKKIDNFQKFGSKQKVSFALSFLGLMLISGVFQIWVFTFYFSAVGLRIHYVMTAYIIWAFWNAINDPIMGLISDHTRTRWGRRKPFIMLGTIPTVLILIFVWMPPNGNQVISFLYLLLMLFLFDTFYTMLEVPLGCLFPELYTSVEERSEVNNLSQIFSVIGLICAFLIPGILIEDITLREGYLIGGIIMALILGISLLISLRWGVLERPEFIHDSEHPFGFFQGLKYTLKNRGFILYTIMFLSYEYVTTMQGTLVPLYSKYVLEVEGSLEASILLALLFIVAIITMIIWRIIDLKIGSRAAFFISIITYFVTIIPLTFISDYMSALIVFGILGFGFGGMIYFIYLIIADVIDEDEIKTGIRREGSFYGITAFFLRYANILSILTISLVFTTTGWEEFTPDPRINVIVGLRFLMVLFPSIALIIISICLYFYPFTKSYVMEIKEKLYKLHEMKRKRLAEEKDSK